jgi:hypothetical protein
VTSTNPQDAVPQAADRRVRPGDAQTALWDVPRGVPGLSRDRAGVTRRQPAVRQTVVAVAVEPPPTHTALDTPPRRGTAMVPSGRSPADWLAAGERCLILQVPAGSRVIVELPGFAGPPGPGPGDGRPLTLRLVDGPMSAAGPQIDARRVIEVGR